jgi:hypothetical protein
VVHGFVVASRRQRGRCETDASLGGTSVIGLSVSGVVAAGISLPGVSFSWIQRIVFGIEGLFGFPMM